MSPGAPLQGALVIERLDPAVKSGGAAPTTSRLLVELDPAASCQRCARGEGCGAALLQPRNWPVQLIVNDQLGAVAGQRVCIAVDPDSDWLWVVAGAYGLPTLGLLLGAALPRLTGLEAGGAAASGAALGLFSGIFLWQRIIEPRLQGRESFCAFSPDPTLGSGVIETAHTVSIESAEVS